jgi:hydroxypyruvate reductase
VIATAHKSLEAAAAVFRAAGITPMLLGDTVTGEAREVAKVHAAIAREIIGYGQPTQRPVAPISGGDGTVTLKSPNGRGGRCSRVPAVAGRRSGRAPPARTGLAADTDGIDGSGPNAGAWVSPEMWGGCKRRAACAPTSSWRPTTPSGFFEIRRRLDSIPGPRGPT